MTDIHGAVPQLHDYLAHSALAHPQQVALVCGSVRLSYAQLERASNALAGQLLGAGVARGDRVMVYGDNTPDTVVAFWAALKANAVPCVVNPLTRQDKLAYLLADATPSAFITQHTLHAVFAPCLAQASSVRATWVSGLPAGRAAEPLPALPGGRSWEAVQLTDSHAPAPPRTNIDQDLATLIYTSGSTGQPKGVMLTHRNMITACESITHLLDLRQSDVILSVLPLAFNYGLYQMIMAFRAGARLVLERSFAFPARTLQLVAQEGVTGLPGVPTIFALITQMTSLDPALHTSVRFITNTAANLPQKHIARLGELFPQARIFSMYGLTECKRCTCLPPDDLARKPDSVGLAIPNTEMWLVDEHHQRLGPGGTGELVIRGGTVMKGYWNKPEETAKRLRPHGNLPGEMVFYTGDRCHMDADGYLYFIGRMDDIIKSRGEKVAPKEVENALMNLHGVREAAVIGVPDDILGQAIKAFVVLDEGAHWSERQLQIECQRRLESFMVPQYIVLVTELPKTDTGKIKKLDLPTHTPHTQGNT